ncbi:MAG: signal peptide peptidase SppA [Planctomycetes bacterium]|nr:signal peptide peptidase SppA [Planctomycetota bacterium]
MTEQPTPPPTGHEATHAQPVDPAYYAYYYGYGQQQQPAAPAPRRPNFGLLVGLCGVFLVFALCMVTSSLTQGAGEDSATPRALTEITVSGEGEDKIALIELKGVIAEQQTTGGGMFGVQVNLVERLEREFAQAGADDKVKAVLFRIDSPGGTVSASDQIWHVVSEFRRTQNKPVIVHMGGTCASGGYYIAVACDALICEPTTITGSIGVILSTLNFSELLKKYGVSDVTIKSGANKDLLNSTAPPNAEHLEILQGMVDESHARFVELVAKGRPIDPETVAKLADGRIYTAKQALKHKLVDGIGYREDALAEVRKRAKLGKAKLVRYRAPTPTFLDAISGNANTTPAIAPTLLDQVTGPRLLVLWRGR